MKRLLIMAALILAWATLSTLGPEPAEAGGQVESWGKARAFSTAADTIRRVPAFLGNTFRAKKLMIAGTHATSSGTIKVTTYYPLAAGPASATDSLVFVYYAKALGGVSAIYYFELSDSILIQSTANTSGEVYLFGD